MLQTIEKVGLRWLLRFRKLDMTQPEQRQALVDTFINAIYLYDDKVLITFNYKEGTETVAFGEAVKAEKSSDMSARGAPDIERQIVRFDVLFYVGKRLHTFCTSFAHFLNIGSFCARPFCRLKAQLGLSLLRCASQTRTFENTPLSAECKKMHQKLWKKERGLDDASPLVGHNCAITAPISPWMQTDCRSISGGQTACP